MSGWILLPGLLEDGQDSRTILTRELASVHEILHPLGGELIFNEGGPESSLLLPARTGPSQSDSVQ